MGSALSPLRALLITLRRLLQSPWLFTQATFKLLRKYVLWAGFLIRKRFNGKKDDRKPKDDSEPPKAEVARLNGAQHDLKFTFIPSGDAVSLNGVARSLYPFSSHGIRSSRSSRSSVRATQSIHMNGSRTSLHGDSDTHSNAPSIYDLPLHTNPSGQHPVRPRNPHRQTSTSLPDLNGNAHYRASNVFRPASGDRSPSPDIGIEVASPTSPAGNHSRRNSNEIPEREPYLPLRPQSLRVSLSDHSRSSSPIDLIPEEEPFEVTETNYAVPSIHHGRSASRHSFSTTSGKSMHPDTVSLALARSNESDIHTITPTIPEDTKRYTRRTKILKEYHTIELEPLTISLGMPAPSGWVGLVHPEGSRYFYHREMRIYTDSDLYDPKILDRLMNDALRLEQLIETLDKDLPKTAHLMIDVEYEDYTTKSEFNTQYYYVDHDNQVVFFAHKFDSLGMHPTWEINGPVSPHHFRFELCAQYWHFVSLYPDSIELTSKEVSELRDIVLQQIGDHMTSPYSTAPYTMEVLFQILQLTDGIEKNIGSNPGTISMFARYMYIFFENSSKDHSKFLNFYGETCARIERHFSVFGDPLNKRTWLVKSLSIFLFSAPDVHLRNIQRMWVDGIMYRTVWEETTKKLNEEWQEFVFFATVMLTTNVGYLAIQSVDIDQGSSRSAGQIASYLSVIANIGSIILGLLLMRQNRTKRTETADEVQAFLNQRNHPSLGLETLAILYSLPYALLMWGVVAFLVAFSCVFFENSNTSSRSLVGLLSGAVAILIVWCIATSWDTTTQEEEADRPLADFDQLRIEKRKLEESSASSHSRPNAFERALKKLFGKLPRINLTNFTSLVYPRPSVDSEKTAV